MTFANRRDAHFVVSVPRLRREYHALNCNDKLNYKKQPEMTNRISLLLGYRNEGQRLHTA
jgi:hypothetical protein